MTDKERLIIEAEAFFKASDMIRYEYDGGMTSSEIEEYYYEKGKELMSKAESLK